jgi:prepilin-type N-terminal cleavage/methylation domain-containing protein
VAFPSADVPLVQAGAAVRHRRCSVGFTLLEVMVAVVLTSVVALVAFAAAQVSVETRARLEGDLRAVRSERGARQSLMDLLHNVRLPRRSGDTAFVLRGDTLSFIAAGAAPFDDDYDWRITLRPGAAGVEIAASPLGWTPSRGVAFRMANVTRTEVRALAPGGSEWMREWALGRVVPRAVAITFWRDSAPMGPTLYVALSHQPATGAAGMDSDE